VVLCWVVEHIAPVQRTVARAFIYVKARHLLPSRTHMRKVCSLKKSKEAWKRPLVVAAVALASLGAASPAMAAVQYVGGGTWDYGTGGGRVWSDYHHGSRRHQTSVNNGQNHYSSCVGGGNWARASASSRWWTSDKSYWNWC
jgi:lactococcin 972 family bacteriocin